MDTTIIYIQNEKKLKKIWNSDTCKTIAGLPAKQAQNNNADIAVLFDFYPYVLRREGLFGHFKKIYIPLQLKSLLTSFTVGLRYFLRGTLKFKAVEKTDRFTGTEQRYLEFDVHPKKNRKSITGYYPDAWTPLEMLQHIDKLGVKYVLIRWPHKVLNNLPMKDLDILIADEDVAKLRAYMDQYVGTKPIDVHTVHGGEVGRGDNIAYFPPRIGQAILEKRIPMSDQGGYLPCLEEQFKALAYHAIFNKGFRSGLLERDADTVPENTKMYDELKRLRDELGLSVPITLYGILEYLKEENWIPPVDMIAKKAKGNLWLREAFETNKDITAGLNGSYFAFLLRDISKEWDILSELEAKIKDHGFQILHSAPLTEEQRFAAKSDIRGGNWGNGRWQTKAGYPYHLILVEDPTPEKPNRKTRKKEPAITNPRIFVKRAWRKEFNDRLPVEKQANFAHTSDNNLETIEYLNIIDPTLIKLMK